MPVPTSAVKVNPVTGALIDPIAATFASANGFLTSGSSDAKNSVRLATTGAITLASRTSSTLTTAASTLTTDGSAVANGDRLLVKNAPSGGGGSSADCGIFDVSGVGTTVVLTRSSDFDAWTEIVGAFVSVESGTVNAGTQWLCNVVSGGTMGTTAITFVVPKNYVDLTTTQVVGGIKTFGGTDASCKVNGLTIRNAPGVSADNCFLNIDGTGTAITFGGDFNTDSPVQISGGGIIDLAGFNLTATSSGNVYVSGGTDVAVADGGTNLSSYAVGDILYASGTTTLSKLADVAVGSILVSGGVATAPAYSATPYIRTSIDLGHATDTTITRSGPGLIAVEGVNVVTISSTDSLTNKKLGSLTTNGLVTTSGSDGTLSVTVPGTGVLVANINRPIFATTATVAGTTTLTVTSASTQEATGSTTQTYTLPVVTTLVAGWATLFINKSTGNVTLNSSGGNAIVVLAGEQSVTLVCKSISADTTAAAWDVVGLSPRLWVARNAASDTTLPNSTWTLLTFATTNGGNMAGSMTSTIFTAPKAGNIKISFAGLFYGQLALGGDIAEFGLRVQKNAEAVATSALMMADWAGADSNSRFNGWYNPSIVLSCAAGDTFKIYGYYDNSGDDGEAEEYSAVVEYLDA
jgi:hypothetical protein